MQGVQGTWKSGRTRTAAYEEYGILGRCPECREGLVYAGEERTELACSYCGIVVSKADSTSEDGSSAPSVSKSEPLGSYIVVDTESTPSLKGAAFGWAKLMPNLVGRGGPMLTCSALTNRIAGRVVSPQEHRGRAPTSRQGDSSQTEKPMGRPSPRYPRIPPVRVQGRGHSPHQPQGGSCRPTRTEGTG